MIFQLFPKSHFNSQSYLHRRDPMGHDGTQLFIECVLSKMPLWHVFFRGINHERKEIIYFDGYVYLYEGLNLRVILDRSWLGLGGYFIMLMIQNGPIQRAPTGSTVSGLQFSVMSQIRRCGTPLEKLSAR